MVHALLFRLLNLQVAIIRCIYMGITNVGVQAQVRLLLARLGMSGRLGMRWRLQCTPYSRSMDDAVSVHRPHSIS